MVELGALILVGLLCMAWFVAEWVKIDNEFLKSQQNWKNANKWNWD